MSTHSLLNNTGSAITLAGKCVIPAGDYVDFYISSEDSYRYMDAIQASMTADSTGLNALLQTGDISYVQDTVPQTSSAFYAIWDVLYNDYLVHKMASLYSSYEDVILEQEQGSLGTRRYVFLMGGGILHRLSSGLWHGDIGAYDNPTHLPPTTYLAVGSSATVTRTELCAEMWHVAGIDGGPKYWKAEASVFSPWNAAGRNLFVKADQTTENIVDGVYIGATGQQVSSADCYVSKPIPVTPGTLIACHASESQLYPISFYDANMVWVATFDKSVWHNDTYGHYQIPAGCAFARLNVQRTYEDTTWFSIVSQTTIDATALSTKKFVALGDSVTNGVGTDTENIWWRLAAKAEGYKNLVNLGIGGSLVTGLNEFSMSTRLATIDADANAISFMGGINDWGSNVPLGTLNDSPTLWQSSFYGALKYIAEYIKAHHAFAKVYWCTPQRFPTCIYTNTIGLTLSDYANAVLDVGREYGFICVDFFHDMTVDLSKAPFNWMFLSDTLHLNIAGNRLLGSCFIDYLKMNRAYSSTDTNTYRSFSDLTATQKDRVLIAGGGVLRKVGGLWLGDIGLFDSEASLPATTTLACGATARVGTPATGYTEWYVYGSNGTRTWRCKESQHTTSGSLVGGNLFVLADQTAENIIDDCFVTVDGSTVAAVGTFYVSKPIPVTPGDLLVIGSTTGVNIPVVFYDASMTWISTPDYTQTVRTNGHMVAPAGAAYARLNVGRAAPWYLFGKINTNAETSLRKPKKLVVLGDSISQGVSTATDAESIWWLLAAKEAGITETVNLASAGYTITQIISQQITVIPNDADIIQLLTGIPDYAIGTTPLGTSSDIKGTDSFYGWLDYAAFLLTTMHATAKLIWCTTSKYPYGVTNPNGYGNTLADYAEAVRVVAARYSITLVDFYDGLGVDFSTERGAQTYLDSGYLHPNILGNRLMANKYVPYLTGTAGITTRIEATGLGDKQTINHALGLGNLYVPADLVAPNIISDSYIGADGQVVAAVGFFTVSKYYPVKAGDLLSIVVGPAAVVGLPASFYDVNHTWISTINTSTTVQTNGHYTAPAGAAYIRLNIYTGYESTARLHVVPTNNDLWWSKRIPRKYVALGDSISAGTGTTAEATWWKMSTKKAKFEILSDLSANDCTVAWLTTNSVAYKVWNNQIPLDADVIGMMGGINDYSKSFALGSSSDEASTYATSFYGSLKFIATYIRDKVPLATVIWCTSTRCSSCGENPNSAGHTLGDYAKAIVYVGKLFGFTVVDFYNDMSTKFDVDPYSAMFLGKDGVHPNIAGHRVMSKFYTPYLEANGSLGVPYAVTAFGSSGTVGPQGPQGTQGAQGATGAQGNQGTQGVRGYQGYQGYQGSNGAQGATGAQGNQGATGAQGASYTTTSTTSVAIGTGSKTLTVSAGLGYAVGQILIISYTTTPTNYMVGQVTSYSGTSLVVNVTNISGSGTFTAWTITPAGAVGPQGAQGNQGAQGTTGAQGNQGAAGAQGSQGAQGAQGFSNISVVTALPGSPSANTLYLITG